MGVPAISFSTLKATFDCIFTLFLENQLFTTSQDSLGQCLMLINAEQNHVVSYLMFYPKFLSMPINADKFLSTL